MTPGVPTPDDERRAHIQRLCQMARAEILGDLLSEAPPAEATRILLRLQQLYPGPSRSRCSGPERTHDQYLEVLCRRGAYLHLAVRFAGPGPRSLLPAARPVLRRGLFTFVGSATREESAASFAAHRCA